MSDEVEMKIASSESVALSLALDIASQESFYSDKSNYRKQMLDLYAECLKATRGFRKTDGTS